MLLVRGGVLRQAAFLGLLAMALQAHADEFEGRVVGVADGDTVTVLEAGRIQHKVRLAGIDAPEKRQPFGQRSKQRLSDVVFGRPVRIEWSKEDRYGRKVGKVWVADPGCRSPDCPKTLDANLAQITAGMAWWYRAYAKEQSAQDRGRYEFAETEARARRAGLWSEPAAVAPWDWRRQLREDRSIARP